MGYSLVVFLLRDLILGAILFQVVKEASITASPDLVDLEFVPRFIKERLDG